MKNHVKASGGFDAPSKFSSPTGGSETTMRQKISYHSLPCDKRCLITICADAGRRNGDFYDKHCDMARE